LSTEEKKNLLISTTLTSFERRKKRCNVDLSF